MCLHYIERREGNIINTQELKKILAQAPKETDHWDFKQKWYSKENGGNGELVLDILNFANTVHNDDCYIILGVSDDGKIVGVETDPNRKNTQKLQDLISKVDFAQNSYPKTNIETFEIDGHSLDVITIYNSKEVPYFLRKNKKRKNKAEIIAGKIYSRVGDSKLQMMVVFQTSSLKIYSTRDLASTKILILNINAYLKRLIIGIIF